jgi:hypothetical protein
LIKELIWQIQEGLAMREQINQLIEAEQRIAAQLLL